MSVELHFNAVVTPATPGQSLFTYGEQLGIPVPTSCNKQGKCRECMIEVTEGAALLSPRTPEEQHLPADPTDLVARVARDAVAQALDPFFK